MSLGDMWWRESHHQGVAIVSRARPSHCATFHSFRINAWGVRVWLWLWLTRLQGVQESHANVHWQKHSLHRSYHYPKLLSGIAKCTCLKNRADWNFLRKRIGKGSSTYHPKKAFHGNGYPQKLLDHTLNQPPGPLHNQQQPNHGDSTLDSTEFVEPKPSACAFRFLTSKSYDLKRFKNSAAEEWMWRWPWNQVTP